MWPDANGKTSWLGRFLDYLRQHGRMNDLAFFSFEHYPYDGCKTPWGTLYDEPELVSHIMQIWREDGVPADLPMFITESNLSSAASETYMDMFAGVWLADYIGSFLTAGGKGVYYFHYLPLQMEHGCNDSPGTFGMFTVDINYQVQQPLSQFFVSQQINLEWVQPGVGQHIVFPAKGDIDDGAGHALVTAYALKRPDGEWSVMAVNWTSKMPIAYESHLTIRRRRRRNFSPARLKSRLLERTNINGIRRRLSSWRTRTCRGTTCNRDHERESRSGWTNRAFPQTGGKDALFTICRRRQLWSFGASSGENRRRRRCQS